MTKGPCTVEGCENEARTRRSGLCSNHYQRMRRNGDPTISGWDIDRPRKPGGRWKRPKATTRKKCAICKQVKPSDQFYTLRRGTNEFLDAYCKPCKRGYYANKRAEERAKRPPKAPKVPVSCAFEGCHNEGKTRLEKGKGELYCNVHYNQHYAGNELTPLRDWQQSYVSDDLRKCTSCMSVKSVEAFHQRTNGTRHSRCKDCSYFAVRFTKLLAEGRAEDALSVSERMPEAMRIKYVTKYAQTINEALRSDSTASDGLEESA